MVRYSKERIKNVKYDRATGLTIHELMNKYDMPKTTIWHHVQGVILSPDIQKKISSRRGGSAARCRLRWDKAEASAQKLLEGFDLDTQWVSILTALYWSEGTKKTGYIFTNTDADMVRLYLKILRKYLGVTNDRLQILVRLTTTQNPVICKKYWARLIGLSSGEIRLDINDRQNSSTNKYGICRITVAKGSDYLKLIHSLIQGITERSLKE